MTWATWTTIPNQPRLTWTDDRDALQPELAIAGADGWELVSTTAMFNTWMSKVIYTLFLKRPAA